MKKMSKASLNFIDLLLSNVTTIKPSFSLCRPLQLNLSDSALLLDIFDTQSCIIRTTR
jgi:hypothetical protein